MAKKTTTALTAKEQLSAEAALTTTGQAKAASAISRAGIAERRGTPVPAVITTPIDEAKAGITTSEEAFQERDSFTKGDSGPKLHIQPIITQPVGTPTFEEADTSEMEELIEERRSKLQEGLTQQEEYIQEIFAQRKAEQEAANRQLLGSSRAFLGRAGAFSSASGQGAIQAQVQAGQQAIDELTSLETQAMAQARQAADASDFELLTKKLAVADEARQEANSLRQKQFENVLSMSNLAMEEAASQREGTRFELEMEQDKIDSITGGVVSGLTGNASTDLKIIERYAKQYKVDSNKLIQSIDSYNQEKTKNDIYIAGQYQSIAGNIPVGQTWQDPTSGMYFLGSQDPEQLEVVQTVGNTEYKVRYKVVDGQPVEQFRIELGQKWKTGDSTSTSTPVDAAFKETVMALYSTKQSGIFNDSIYQAAVGAFADTYGVDYGTASSEINQWLEQMDIGGGMEAEEEETQAPTTQIPISQRAGSALGSFFKEGVANKYMMDFILSTGGGATRFMEGLTGLPGVSKEELEDIKQKLGAR